MNSIDEIARQIEMKDAWLLIGHAIPDGDCIGSMLGLGLGLAALGKRVQIAMQDPLPENYRYLQGLHLIKSSGDRLLNYEGLIVLDCSDTERVDEDLKYLLENRKIPRINIDHHPTNEQFGDYNYVDAGAAATGEIVLQLLETLQVEIKEPVAQALFAALVMDTCGFMNANTTSATMNTAAALLASGVDLNITRTNLFESKSRLEMLLLREALQTLDFSSDGSIGWMLLPYDKVAGIGALDLHPEGLVNYALKVKGVEVGLLFRETKPGFIKIGFRSKGRIDVASLAQDFGGGGHRQAAGARMEGPLNAVKDLVVTRVKEVI